MNNHESFFELFPTRCTLATARARASEKQIMDDDIHSQKTGPFPKFQSKCALNEYARYGETKLYKLA